MSAGYNPYLFLALFAASALGFALAPLLAARLWARFFSPAKPGRDKNATYECGLEARGDAALPLRAEYYLYAILFLVFDVEMIFLVPFAVAFADVSAGAAIAMLVFILLVAEGLAWAWAKGILRWT